MARPRLDPGGEKRAAKVFMVTPTEEQALRTVLEGMRGVGGSTAHAIQVVRGGEAREGTMGVQVGDGPLQPFVQIQPFVVERQPDSDPYSEVKKACEAIRKIKEQPAYCPSIRECSICGKEYDGNLHESCPHPHEPNGRRKS